jgi:thiamine biosynthesis lipoprotein
VSPRLATASWPALGTTAIVRTDAPETLVAAYEAVAEELGRIDAAASNFRPDSELERLNRAAGLETPVGPLLHEAIAAALRGAQVSGGAVDPTLTGDHDRVELYGTTARLPAGVRLDLGATGKALASDRAARAAANRTHASVLVALGGDIATAGPAPEAPWTVHVTDDHRSSPDALGQTVAIAGGALATSSTTTRRREAGDRIVTHIVDPFTGDSPAGPWRTVSVVAETCVDANIASTAAIVLGDAAIGRLETWGLAARLIGHHGEVVTVGGWPDEVPA